MSPKAKAWAAALITAVAGAFTQLLALGVLNGTAAKVAEIIGAAITTFGATLGVYGVPNAPAPPPAQTFGGSLAQSPTVTQGSTPVPFNPSIDTVTG